MGKRILSFVLTVFIASGSLLYSQKAKTHIKTAKEFLENGKLEFALEQYTKAIELEPNNEETYISRGLVLKQLERYEESVSDFQKAATFDPKNHEIYYLMGVSSNLADNYDSALVYLNKATLLKWIDPRIYPEKVKSLTELERFSLALQVADSGLKRERGNPETYYLRGIIYEKLRDKTRAREEYEEAISFDKKYLDAHIALTELLVQLNEVELAMEHAAKSIELDEKDTRVYSARSKVYVARIDYPSAINDISKNILLEPKSPKHYIERGIYYQEFNQHSNAINDFSKAISLDEKDANPYLLRAKSYEETSNFEDAARDYKKITALSEYDIRARVLLDKANERMYEINREEDAPEVLIDKPLIEGKSLKIAGNINDLIISGKIKEANQILKLTVNGEKIHYEGSPGEYTFLANTDIEFANKLEIVAVDTYYNETVIAVDIERMETDPPVVKIMAPYASDNGEIYLESNNPVVFLQGRLVDESPIKSIFIEGVTASYKVDELNPEFTATVNVANKGSIKLDVEDLYGNKQTVEYKLNREGAIIAETNPMGKTWVIFIENSKYETFASLDGPIKDINLMKKALSSYSIHNIIHKNDMKKEEMEKFFSIELRDLVRKNQVKSLMVWYAGHGKFINNVGYWIPIDAKRDDEFTYFNINSLRAGMQGYTDILVHTLIVTDACESGPSFYTAMRDDRKTPNCGDWQSTRFKSSQVFSSAGYELAVDDSQFTRTFASSLINNPNECIPIESIVNKVNKAVKNSQQQEPLFGKIKGFEDENGTFFFITKSDEE